jgi:hypothetical protein
LVQVSEPDLGVLTVEGTVEHHPHVETIQVVMEEEREDSDRRGYQRLPEKTSDLEPWDSVTAWPED